MSERQTSAMHAQHGKAHVVGLNALRVMLLEDEGSWFAQGLEIDYAASGRTIDEAKSNFEEGFRKTIHEHLLMHGGIERFLKVADQAAWDEYLQPPTSAEKLSFSCVQLYDIPSKDEMEFKLPFDSIAFISRAVEHKAHASA